jgi:hypothetical protein
MRTRPAARERTRALADASSVHAGDTTLSAARIDGLRVRLFSPSPRRWGIHAGQPGYM